MLATRLVKSQIESRAMKHVIEITNAPYSAGSPRRYFAADYSIGSAVVDCGVIYYVRDIDGVSMFVPA